MDLKYIRENDIHEKYLLNQLNPEEKAEYQSFLKKSGEALKELEETRQVISRIRTIGHESMRREIDEQVREIKNPKTDWTMLYKAAAVLFLFAILPAVVYYNVYVLDIQLQSEEQLIMDALIEKEDKETEEEMFTENEADISTEEIKISEKAKQTSVPKKNKERALSILSPSIEKKGTDAEDILGSVSGAAGKSSFSIQSAGSGKSAASEQLADNAILESADIEANKDAVSLESEAENILEEKMTISDQSQDNRTSLKTSIIKRSAQTQPIMAPVQSKKPKVLEIEKNGKGLYINLVHSFKSGITDSLQVQIMGDTTIYKVELYIPSQLFIINENEISVDWNADLVSLKFNDEASFQFRLNKNEKYAKKINQDNK